MPFGVAASKLLKLQNKKFIQKVLAAIFSQE
jgi:hypothetical protein